MDFLNAAILRVGYQRHEAALDTARLKVSFLISRIIKRLSAFLSKP